MKTPKAIQVLSGDTLNHLRTLCSYKSSSIRYTVGKLRQDPEYEVSLSKIVGLHLRKKKQNDEVEISEFFEELVVSCDVFLETVL